MKKLKLDKAFVAAATATTLSACAVMQVDVDMYKGPLANHEEVLTEQFAVTAAAAHPILENLQTRLAFQNWAKCYETLYRAEDRADRRDAGYVRASARKTERQTKDIWKQEQISCLLPNRDGGEIVVRDDGTRRDALQHKVIRTIFDACRGTFEDRKEFTDCANSAFREEGGFKYYLTVDALEHYFDVGYAKNVTDILKLYKDLSEVERIAGYIQRFRPLMAKLRGLQSEMKVFDKKIWSVVGDDPDIVEAEKTKLKAEKKAAAEKAFTYSDKEALAQLTIEGLLLLPDAKPSDVERKLILESAAKLIGEVTESRNLAFVLSRSLNVPASQAIISSLEAASENQGQYEHIFRFLRRETDQWKIWLNNDYQFYDDFTELMYRAVKLNPTGMAQSLSTVLARYHDRSTNVGRALGEAQALLWARPKFGQARERKSTEEIDGMLLRTSGTDEDLAFREIFSNYQRLQELGTPFTSARLPEGLTSLMWDYFCASDGSTGFDDSRRLSCGPRKRLDENCLQEYVNCNQKRALERLKKALVRFAEKVAFLANHQALADLVNNGEQNMYQIMTLQALGNSMLVYANELTYRHEHDAKARRTGEAELRAARLARAKDVMGKLKIQLEEQEKVVKDKGAEATAAKAALKAAIDAASAAVKNLGMPFLEPTQITARDRAVQTIKTKLSNFYGLVQARELAKELSALTFKPNSEAAANHLDTNTKLQRIKGDAAKIKTFILTDQEIQTLVSDLQALHLAPPDFKDMITLYNRVDTLEKSATTLLAVAVTGRTASALESVVKALAAMKDAVPEADKFAAILGVVSKLTDKEVFASHLANPIVRVAISTRLEAFYKSKKQPADKSRYELFAAKLDAFKEYAANCKCTDKIPAHGAPDGKLDMVKAFANMVEHILSQPAKDKEADTSKAAAGDSTEAVDQSVVAYAELKLEVEGLLKTSLTTPSGAKICGPGERTPSVHLQQLSACFGLQQQQREKAKSEQEKLDANKKAADTALATIVPAESAIASAEGAGTRAKKAVAAVNKALVEKAGLPVRFNGDLKKWIVSLAPSADQESVETALKGWTPTFTGGVFTAICLKNHHQFDEEPAVKDDCRGDKAVLDQAIRELEQAHIQAIRENGEGSPEVANIRAALKAAFDYRGRKVFIRPPSAYLRAGLPATVFQGRQDIGFRNNMLEKHMGQVLLPGTRKSTKYDIRRELDAQNWQNINSVRVAGGGNTNYAIAKDPVGNWYVKSYATDVSSIIKSVKGLALYSAGRNRGLDLLNTGQDGELTVKSGLDQVFDKFEKTYREETETQRKEIVKLLDDDTLAKELKQKVPDTHANDEELKGQVDSFHKTLKDAHKKRLEDAAQEKQKDVPALDRVEAGIEIVAFLEALQEFKAKVQNAVSIPAPVPATSADDQTDQSGNGPSDAPPQNADAIKAANSLKAELGDHIEITFKKYREAREKLIDEFERANTFIGRTIQ